MRKASDWELRSAMTAAQLDPGRAAAGTERTGFELAEMRGLLTADWVWRWASTRKAVQWASWTADGSGLWSE